MHSVQVSNDRRVFVVDRGHRRIQEGDLYLAEVFNGRVQKFRPKKGADPAKLIGQELCFKAAATN